MIVCHCANVTDRDIRAAIDRGADNVRAIIKATGAGRCCAPCRDEIGSILGTRPQLDSRNEASGIASL